MGDYYPPCTFCEVLLSDTNPWTKQKLRKPQMGITCRSKYFGRHPMLSTHDLWSQAPVAVGNKSRRRFVSFCHQTHFSVLVILDITLGTTILSRLLTNLSGNISGKYKNGEIMVIFAGLTIVRIVNRPKMTFFQIGDPTSRVEFPIRVKLSDFKCPRRHHACRHPSMVAPTFPLRWVSRTVKILRTRYPFLWFYYRFPEV